MLRKKFYLYCRNNNGILHLVCLSLVISYLPDDALRELVMQAREQPWALGLLPNPEMKHARYEFGIASTFEEAVMDIVDNTAE